MGKGSKATVGYWYKVAYHAGLGVGPIDAFLEFRGGDITAWSGNLTTSGTISINAPNLWGGEKDQGGIVGDADVMFGEATQQPNAYLLSTFGNQVPAWRGIASLVFKGGRYGAMNPYPQKPSYKFARIVKGWDNDACWYPEKAVVPISSDTTLPVDALGWEYVVVPKGSDPGHTGLVPPASGWQPAPAGPWTNGNIWPMQTTLWVRRSVTITGINQVCHLAADNGCVMLVNGAVVGASNADNIPIASNENNPVSIPLAVGSTYQIAGKAFSEDNPADDSGSYCSVSITAAGLSAMNPAHILYDAKTQQDMGREPIANMNDASFRAGADWYYQQNFGLCTEYDPASETLDDFVSRIEKVAGCSVSRSPIDGQCYLDIANGVYDLASLPRLTDDDILSFSESPTILDSATNSVSVQYFDPQLKETLTTPPVQALALVDAFGTIHDQTSYLEIPTSDLAVRVATRDVRASVTPTRAFELTTTRLPYAWRVGTYFRLQSPKRGIADMVCLLAEKSSGTLKSGAITITATQDIYSLPTAAFVDTEHGVDTSPSPIPVAIAVQMAFEAPYVTVVGLLSRADMAALPSDVGYLQTVAADPAFPSTSLNYALTVSSGGDYVATATGDWCACATIAASSGFDDTAFVLTNGYLLGNVAVGTGALWDNEIVRVDAIDAVSGSLVLGRSCADTVPMQHAAGSTIWFYGTETAADATEYAAGETVEVKLLTNTGSQQLDPPLATALAVTFDSRIVRPYPPGAVQLNGASPWNTPAITGSIKLTWAHRDRILQADQLIDATAANIGPENGTSYNVRVYATATGAIVANLTGISGTSASFTPTVEGAYRVELESQRDGLISLQMYSLPLTITNLDVNFYSTEDGSGAYATEDGTGFYQAE